MMHHLQFNWWKYAAIVILSVALWCGIFGVLAAPGQDQQISIVYIGSDLDTQALQSRVQDALSGQQVREVTVTAVLPDEASYKSSLMNYSVSYDIIIIEESSLADKVGQTVFARLTEALLAQFPDAAAYTEQTESGTLPFGLTLYDGTAQTNFSACYAGTECCYVFFSPYSVNFDGLNEYNAGSSTGLKTVQFLLEKLP